MIFIHSLCTSIYYAFKNYEEEDNSLINASIFPVVSFASASPYGTASLAPQTGPGQQISFSNRPKMWQCNCLHTHPIIPVFNFDISGHPLSKTFESKLISRISCSCKSSGKSVYSTRPFLRGTKTTHGHVESLFK